MKKHVGAGKADANTLVLPPYDLEQWGVISGVAASRGQTIEQFAWDAIMDSANGVLVLDRMIRHATASCESSLRQDGGEV